MDSVELTARREALGLGVYALADHLNVRHQNVVRWEAGKNPPRDWSWIDAALTELEGYRDRLIEGMISVANEAYETEGSLDLITYTTDDHYWDWVAEAKDKCIPVGLHRAATALAASRLRAEHQKPVMITRAPRGDIF
ncbi:hypothetical protein ACTXIU_13320 [Glutamicibacter arilaitensis]|uniref:hypothetical protein n=1 Tax=Glutamicibacter arilaitensis TaxID=256701 RepID=UPI003FD1C84F